MARNLLARGIAVMVLVPLLIVGMGVYMQSLGPAYLVMKTGVLGVGAAMKTVYGLGFAAFGALVLLLFLWLIFGPVRSDTFQGVRQR